MLNDLSKRVQELVVENSAAILTAVGVVGTASTAVLVARASIAVGRELQKEEDQRIRHNENIQDQGVELTPPTLKEKVIEFGPQYIPAIGVGGITVASIIMSNRMSTSKAAALAAAYGVKEKAFQEYKDKAAEKLGIKKNEEVQAEIAQDRINANPPGNIIVVGTGEVLCYDVLTDRYFQSTVEKIRQAENTVNYDIAQHDEVSLSRFYEELGLKVTPYSDTVGWNIDRRCSVQFSTVMTDDGRPCIAVDFAQYPEITYHKTWE